VKHQASGSFWRAYGALPPEVQQLAEENFLLLKSNPRHPSLRFKKVDRFWSARVGLHYRALAGGTRRWSGSGSEITTSMSASSAAAVEIVSFMKLLGGSRES
jgi:hypothetical protein